MPSDSSVTFTETNEFTITWTIPDFYHWFSQITNWKFSPRCPPAESAQTQWALKFVPESNTDSSYCSLYLRLEKCPKQQLAVGYELTMMNVEKEILKRDGIENSSIRTGHSRGFHNYIKRDFLFNKMKTGNTLIITCKVSINADNNDESDEPKRKLSVDLGALLESNKFGDIVFKLGDQLIRAHKAILASRSSVFAAMFESEMKEQTTNMVLVEDIQSEVFDELLRYIYTDKVNSLDSMSFELYAAADKYDLQGLVSLCRTYLLRNLSADNVLEMLVCADQRGDNDMKSRALNFLGDNRSAALEVTKTAGWNQLLSTHPHLVTEAFQTLANKM